MRTQKQNKKKRKQQETRGTYVSREKKTFTRLPVPRRGDKQKRGKTVKVRKKKKRKTKKKKSGNDSSGYRSTTAVKNEKHMTLKKKKIRKQNICKQRKKRWDCEKL